MRRATTIAALAITSLFALPAGALAGGWANVVLSSTPDGLAPGAAWNVDIEVLQHGRTPLSDVHPTVTIAAGSDSRTFATRPTGKPGVHRARVAFPTAGTWRYVVDDGFTARHSYPPVRIGGSGGAASARAADDGDGPRPGRFVLAALAGLAAAALVLILGRGHRRGRARPPVLERWRMRPLLAPAAGLVAAAAVLLALGGPGGGAGGAGTTATASASSYAAGRATFARMGCGGCHRLASAAGSGHFGPDLDGLLSAYDARSLRWKIVDPYPAGPPADFLSMPEDYGARLAGRELDELVGFLLATARR